MSAIAKALREMDEAGRAYHVWPAYAPQPLPAPAPQPPASDPMLERLADILTGPDWPDLIHQMMEDDR